MKDRISVTKTLETTPDGLGKGELFAGRFELIEELGAGGMGIVYRAYDKKVGEEIALKLLHPEIALDERTVERFRNEIKLARKISHRNVCRMYELHEDGKTLFITMEYVSGQDLKGLIRETGALDDRESASRSPSRSAKAWPRPISLGVIHRDLKPQNIMVDKDGNAKIMDFGIARSLRAAGMTADGMIIGTPEYMSPEQVEGKEADQRSDIYAGGDPLRDGDGPGAFRGRLSPVGGVQAQERDPHLSPQAQRRDSRAVQQADPALPGEGKREPLSDGRGAAGRPHPDRGGPADLGAGRAPGPADHPDRPRKSPPA